MPTDPLVEAARALEAADLTLNTAIFEDRVEVTDRVRYALGTLHTVVERIRRALPPPPVAPPPAPNEEPRNATRSMAQPSGLDSPRKPSESGVTAGETASHAPRCEAHGALEPCRACAVEQQMRSENTPPAPRCPDCEAGHARFGVKDMEGAYHTLPGGNVIACAAFHASPAPAEATTAPARPTGLCPGFWWCPRCGDRVDSGRVTFEETHDGCGEYVEWKEEVIAMLPPPAPASPATVPVEVERAIRRIGVARGGATGVTGLDELRTAILAALAAAGRKEPK